MTKRQKQILKAIDDGCFALCHLYDEFKLTYPTLKKHVAKLESLGYVTWDKDDIFGGTFMSTLEGRQAVTPLNLK